MAVSMYDVTLRGVALSSLADEIIVRDIVEMQPTEDRQSAKRAMKPGTMVNSIVRRTLPVKIVFVIRAYNSVRRAEIMDSIAEWVGAGGEMTISTRPGKALYVKPDRMPSLGSSLKWTEDIELVLTAFSSPYWRDAEPTAVMLNAQLDEADGLYRASDVITAPGNVEAITMRLIIFASDPGNGYPTYIKVIAGDTMMELKGMQQGAAMIVVSYTSDDLLEINVDDEPGLKYRTAESSDDLLLRCGEENTVSVESDSQVAVRCIFWGVWL